MRSALMIIPLLAVIAYGCGGESTAPSGTGGAGTGGASGSGGSAGGLPDSGLPGCGCKLNPQGQGRCTPLCGATTDCVQQPNKVMICDSNGFCSPDKSDGGNPPPNDSGADGSNPPPDDSGGPTACQVEADCVATCPPDATQGCGCQGKDGGQSLCTSRCTVAGDCPVSSGKTMTCDPDGFCAPAP